MSTNVYLIIGNDEAQISETSAKLIEKVAGPTPDAFSLDVYQEPESGVEPELIINLIRSLQSPPFLGGTKTVWLKHFSSFSAETVKSSDVGKALRELAQFISNGIPKDIVLVMDGPYSADKKSRGELLKACEAYSKESVIILSKPDKMNRNWQEDMSICINNAAKDKGVALQGGVVEYLIEVLGTDTARIDSELEKLICYKGGTEQPITVEDARLLCEGQGEEFSWSFGNAIGKRNINDCLRIIDAMSERTNDADRIARSLILTAAGYFRQMLQLQIFMSQNHISTPSSLNMALKNVSSEQRDEWKKAWPDIVSMHPFRAQKLAEDAMRYKPQEAIRAMTIFRDALWQCMSSSTSARVSLENALFESVVKPSR
ncbi:MAG: hypothetical protein J6X55_12130 [Victivallales bacterium]|nr:hypothetical protein [Victivallales bacterium]